jgi:FMN phosphatase YigB (HAD superfamily)
MGLGTKTKANLRVAGGSDGARLEPAAARSGKATPGEAPRRVIRGLILEMTNVLYDATLWRREVVRLLVRLGVPATYPAWFDRWQREYLVDVQRGFRQYDEAFQAFLLDSGLTWGQIDEVEAFARCQRHDFEQHVRPLPAVAPTLGALARSGMPLVTLCDAAHPAVELRHRLERLALGGIFREVISSFDLGAAKPSAECYLAALAALELSADQVALVGCDRLSLEGAQSCGLWTIAFNAQEPLEADARLESFADILELVEHWPEHGAKEAGR